MCYMSKINSSKYSTGTKVLDEDLLYVDYKKERFGLKYVQLPEVMIILIS